MMKFLSKILAAGMILSAAGVYAQEPSLEELFKDKAVVLDMIARIVENGRVEVWNESDSRVTIPGKPVGLKLVGTNIVISAQFTPYMNRNGDSLLVAQGQVWIDVPGEGIRYFTTIKTIPMEFGDEVFFFPLGENAQKDAKIEIQLALRPYDTETPESKPPVSDTKPPAQAPKAQ